MVVHNPTLALWLLTFYAIIVTVIAYVEHRLKKNVDRKLTLLYKKEKL